jgi:hypothetical protein
VLSLLEKVESYCGDAVSGCPAAGVMMLQSLAGASPDLDNKSGCIIV